MATIKSYPNNADEYIGAEYPMKWHRGRSKGVFGAEGNLSVTAQETPDMSVNVSDGLGWLTDAEDNGIVFWNDTEATTSSELNLAVDLADGSLSRIDRVIVEWATPNYTAKPEIKILKGTNAVSPTAPALTNTGSLRQISLAQISIPAGSLSIQSAQITDERLNTEVCGLVTDAIGIDTRTLDQQARQLLNWLQAAIEQAISGEIADASVTLVKLADEVKHKLMPQIHVTIGESSTITATCGETVLAETGTDVTFYLPSYGEWTVRATNGTDETVEHVSAWSVGVTELDMAYGVVMGIKRGTSSSATGWTRTDAAVGKTATATVGASAGHSDFDTMPIYKDVERVTLDTTDIMVKIPKFYYRRYVEGGYEYIKICDKPKEGFELHPAFDRESGERDYILVGAYKTTAGHFSKSGLAPLTNITRAAFRSNARAKGTGWGIIDLAAVSAIQMLILVEFADNNVQSVIGAGWSKSSHTGAKATGSTDSLTYPTGRPSGSSDDVDVIWRGIEGFWGNVWEWTDGMNFNGGAYYVSNDETAYADDTSNGYAALSFTGATNWSQSYITNEGCDANNPWAMLPSAAGSGSGSTYYADGIWSSTGWRVFKRGGRWNDAGFAGLFASYVFDASSAAYASGGSRLLFLPL